MASDSASERFDGYEADLKLVQANISQQLERIPELSGEERKALISQAEGSVEEARELIGSMRIEKTNIPSASQSKINQRLRDYESDVDAHSRKLQSLSSDRAALLGGRYKDDPDADDHLDQRHQLLSGTERLTRSSGRLRDAQQVAHDTENVGAGVLRSLADQRETITHTRQTLLESEGYADRSISTLRSMARRMATNRIVTIAIITVLVILIVAVIYSKFR